MLDRAITDPLRDELRWVARALGSVRDVDVLRALILDLVRELGRTDRLAVDALIDRLDEEGARARAELDEAMTSARYVRLLDRLIALAEHPPLQEGRAKVRPQSKLPRLVKRSWRRVHEHVDGLTADADDDALHEARKRAKQVRYAAEASSRVLGKPAKRYRAGDGACPGPPRRSPGPGGRAGLARTRGARSPRP